MITSENRWSFGVQKRFSMTRFLFTFDISFQEIGSEHIFFLNI